MIRSTFCFLPGIGLGKEKTIWNEGIADWSSFNDAKKIKGVSLKRKKYYDRKIGSAKDALLEGKSKFFLSLPSTEIWRIYDWFRDEAIFLDIETGYRRTDSITIIGMYDGIRTKSLVKGFNLDKDTLKKAMEGCKLLVTFNGSSFDLPVMKKNLAFDPGVPHLDLRYACQRIGLVGGLKEIEKRLNIKRDPDVLKKKGSDAAFLWKMWSSTRNHKYLERLVAYNEEDAVNLKQIADHAFAKLKSMMKKEFPCLS